MRKNYQYFNLYERCIGSHSGKECYQFGWEVGLKEKTHPTLLANFLKVASWVEENCPHLNGEFPCKHDPYSWTKLVVEDGKAYLEYGSHGYRFSIALSATETAVMATGSSQRNPYAFDGELFFRNDALEEFLSQWPAIKTKVITANRIQQNCFSEDFQA